MFDASSDLVEVAPDSPSISTKQYYTTSLSSLDLIEPMWKHGDDLDKVDSDR